MKSFGNIRLCCTNCWQLTTNGDIYRHLMLVLEQRLLCHFLVLVRSLRLNCRSVKTFWHTGELIVSDRFFGLDCSFTVSLSFFLFIHASFPSFSALIFDPTWLPTKQTLSNKISANFCPKTFPHQWPSHFVWSVRYTHCNPCYAAIFS